MKLTKPAVVADKKLDESICRSKRRHYYRAHPERQAYVRSKSKEYRQKYSEYPEFVAVNRLRKDVHRIRESMNERYQHYLMLERRLLEFTEKLQKAEKVWYRMREDLKKREQLRCA